jgi:hypothetical protein
MMMVPTARRDQSAVTEKMTEALSESLRSGMTEEFLEGGGRNGSEDAYLFKESNKGHCIGLWAVYSKLVVAYLAVVAKLGNRPHNSLFVCNHTSAGDGFAAFVEYKVIKIHCLQPAPS